MIIFTIEQRIQPNTLKFIFLKEKFSYEQSRKGLSHNDKLIDGFLINTTGISSRTK